MNEAENIVVTKGDVVSGDKVVVGIASGEILAPGDMVQFVGRIGIEERDEDLLTGFNWGRHDPSGDELVWSRGITDVDVASVGFYESSSIAYIPLVPEETLKLNIRRFEISGCP